MRIYSLSSRAYDFRSAFDPIPIGIFHGQALQEGNGGPSRDSFGDSTVLDPMLMVIADHFPEILIPNRNCNLVVSERYRDQLRFIRPKIRFRHVNVGKVVKSPLPLDIQSFCETETYKRYRNQVVCEYDCVCYLPDSDAAPPQPYFEILAPNHYTLIEACSNPVLFVADNYEGEVLESDCTPICEEIFRQHSITLTSKVLLTEDVFKVIQPAISTDYFGVKWYDFSSDQTNML